MTEVTLDAFLRDALTAVQDVLEADSVSFLVANEEGRELVARASVGLPEQVSLGLHIPSGAGVAGRVIATREPMLIKDLSEYELASPLLRQGGIRSLVIVPVVVDERAAGVLHAGSHREAYFAEDDVTTLGLVADRVATVMERVRLFESERDARSRAETISERIGRLQRITAALSADLNEDGVAKVLCNEVNMELGRGLASCSLWNLRGDVLTLVQQDDAMSTAQPFAEIALDVELPGPAALRSRQPLWIESRDDLHRRFPALSEASTVGERFAVLPLRVNNRSLGVLALGFSRPGSFEAHELDFYLAVAEQAAQAFDRARLRDLEAQAASHNAFLAATSAALAESLDYNETLDKVVRLIVPELADLATIHLFEGSSLARVVLAHRDAEVERAIRAAAEEHPAILGALADVAKGTTLLVEDAISTLTAQEAREALDPLGIRTVLFVPLSDRQHALGVLTVAQVDSRAFDAPTRALIEEIGRRAAVAITNARLHSDLQESQRAASFLLEVATALAGASGFDETLQRLGSVAVPTLGDLCLIDVVDYDGRLQRLVAHHADPERQLMVDELRERYPPDPDGEHPAAELIRQGRSMWATEMTDEFLRRTCRDERHFQLTKALGFSSYMAVPLAVGDVLLGSLTLVSAGSGRRFDSADLALAEDLAEQVAAVIEKARRYEREHRISHILQASLLPSSLPDVSGVRIAVRYLPGTRDAEVGGDFYDALTMPTGRLVLVIGDVAGHDHQAAAVMGHLRSAVRTLAGQVGHPEGILEALHGSWDLLGLDRIATAVFCELDSVNGDVVMVNAGHPPPLLISAGAAHYVPVRPSPPLGTYGDPEIQAWRGKIAPGDTLLFYTDGVIDDRASDLGDRMSALARLASSGATDVEALCDRIVTAMGTDRSDDVALLAVRMAPAESWAV